MYNWKLETDTGITEGRAFTLHDALESLVHYSFGTEQRDFHINGHHMNEEFQLWISGGKVVHDDGSEFVPMNEWYEKLGGGKPAITVANSIAMLNTAIVSTFRPEHFRGAAMRNPSSFEAAGIDFEQIKVASAVTGEGA